MISRKHLKAPSEAALRKMMQRYLDDGWELEERIVFHQGKYHASLIKIFEADIDKFD